jgi:hypothetical protein
VIAVKLAVYHHSTALLHGMSMASCSRYSISTARRELKLMCSRNHTLHVCNARAVTLAAATERLQCNAVIVQSQHESHPYVINMLQSKV